jgi:hypothetical protein
MTTSTIAPAGHRPEAGVAAVSAAAVTATPGAGEHDPSHPPRRPWWRRRWLPSFPDESADEYQRTSLEELLALLEAAREELAAGWVQDGWWSAPGDGGRPALASGLAAGVAGPGPVSAVCLVGALVRAGSRPGPGGQDPGGQGPSGQGPSGQHPRGPDEQSSRVSRAVDAVYDALWESRGQPAAHSGPGLPPLRSPQVRLAQVQTLTRWNDAEGRTGDEVLAVLDRAISRTMLSLAAMPAPAGGPAPQRDREPGRGGGLAVAGDGPASLPVQRVAPEDHRPAPAAGPASATGPGPQGRGVIPDRIPRTFRQLR